MNEAARTLLLSLVDRDLQTRERLAGDGRLFEGYHPEMEAVHRANALALEGLIARIGWPAAAEVGQDGAEAAWLIAQHAIGRPDFQRRCLEALKVAAAAGAVPAWQPAMLLDRIRVFEGRSQVYGTSFDWDEAGLMSPLPIEAPETVDARRAAAGLPPLADATTRRRAECESEPRPTDIAARREAMEAWARKVGWR